MTDSHKFTEVFNLSQSDFFHQIVTNISIKNSKGNQIKEGTALWDTGATISTINKNLIAELILEHDNSITPVKMANGKEEQCHTVTVDLTLPNKVSLLKHKMICFNTGDYISIIGMDIIGSGHFSIKYNQKERQSACQFFITPSVCMTRNFKKR